MEEVRHEMEVLAQEGAVSAELVPDLGEDLGRRLLRHETARGISGSQVDEGEDDERHTKQHRDDLLEAPPKQGS